MPSPKTTSHQSKCIFEGGLSFLCDVSNGKQLSLFTISTFDFLRMATKKKKKKIHSEPRKSLFSENFEPFFQLKLFKRESVSQYWLRIIRLLFFTALVHTFNSY
jgi:hypothetical protein